MKTVSNVMCSYNGEQFHPEQLDSILTQTYPIHELIIQDDCSTDHTADIVREYARQYPFRWKPSATTTCAFPPTTPVQSTAPTGT